MKKLLSLFLSILLISSASVQSAEQVTTVADLIQKISTPSGVWEQ